MSDDDGVLVNDSTQFTSRCLEVLRCVVDVFYGKTGKPCVEIPDAEERHQMTQRWDDHWIYAQNGGRLPNASIQNQLAFRIQYTQSPERHPRRGVYRTRSAVSPSTW